MREDIAKKHDLESSNDPIGWWHMYIAHIRRYGECTLDAIDRALSASIEAETWKWDNDHHVWPNRVSGYISDLQCVMTSTNWFLRMSGGNWYSVTGTIGDFQFDEDTINWWKEVYS